MKNLKKTVRQASLTVLGLALSTLGSTVFAAAGGLVPPTVLPSENENIGGSNDYCVGLADMIRTGNIHLWNIPCFVKYFTQVLIGIGGTLSVIFVMIGGFRYILFGEEGKAKAKDTITHALIGLGVSLLAWIAIDLAIRFATE